MLRVILLSLLLLGAIAAAPRRSPAAPPDQIHALFDAGKYRDVLRQTAIVIALRNADKLGYDLHDIWILKAEAHLRLKQQILSASAFESASNVAPDSATSDLDHATGLAVGESKAGKYVPADQRFDVRAKGTSVIDPADRPKALAALFEDRLSAATDKLDPLDKAKTLKPILEAADNLADLRRIERAATVTSAAPGTSDRTDAVAKKLAVRADYLIGEPLLKEAQDVEHIARNAGQTADVPADSSNQQPPQRPPRKKGLSPTDVLVLNKVRGDCQKIVAECKEMADRLHADPAVFDATSSAATSLSGRAAEILNAQ